jgi:hypothetical protein
MSLATKQKKQKTVWWTLGMTWVLLLLYTWETDGFMAFFHISKYFLTGDLGAVRNVNTTAIPVVAAAVVLLIPLIIILALITKKQVSKHADDFLIPSPQRMFAVIMITMLGEELLARFLFLGLMTKIPTLDGTLAFYLLFLGGNTLWAFLHLLNIANRQGLTLLFILVWVLPSFIGGIFYTMIYASHGFFAALSTHVLYNMVMLSANCRTRFSPSRLVLSFYHLVFLGGYGLLFFGVRNHSLSDIKLALGNQVTNWQFIDYLSLVGVLTTVTFLVLELLWYDLEQNHTRKEYLQILLYTCLLLVLAYFAIKWIDFLFQGNMLIATASLAVCITFIEKVKSGSGISRLFWKCLLLTFVIQIMQVTDWRTALFVLLLFLMYQFGERALRLSVPTWKFAMCLDIYWRAIRYAYRNSPYRETRIYKNGGGTKEAWEMFKTILRNKQLNSLTWKVVTISRIRSKIKRINSKFVD